MFFVDKLNAMGAGIILCDPHRAVVNGPGKLNGADLVSPDVRAGMTMVIAALCAQGKSTIHNVYQIACDWIELGTLISIANFDENERVSLKGHGF